MIDIFCDDDISPVDISNLETIDFCENLDGRSITLLVMETTCEIFNVFYLFVM